MAVGLELPEWITGALSTTPITRFAIPSGEAPSPCLVPRSHRSGQLKGKIET
jgi:hypothetical protein